MRTTGCQSVTQVDMLTATAEPPPHTLTQHLTIYTVTHPSVQTRILQARIIKVAFPTVKPRLTFAHVGRVAQVPTKAVVLTWRRRAGIVTQARGAVVTIVTVAVVFCVGYVLAVAAILARGRHTRVVMFASLSEIPVVALAPEVGGRNIPTRTTVLAERRRRARDDVLTRFASVALCASTAQPTGLPLKFSGSAVFALYVSIRALLLAAPLFAPIEFVTVAGGVLVGRRTLDTVTGVLLVARRSRRTVRTHTPVSRTARQREALTTGTRIVVTYWKEKRVHG